MTKVTEYQKQRILQMFEEESEQKQNWLMESAERLRNWIEWAGRLLGIIIQIGQALAWLRSIFGV